jgi:hypothetical protein
MPTYEPCDEPVRVKRAVAARALRDGIGVSHSIDIRTITPRRQPKGTAEATPAPHDEAREVFTLHDPDTGKPVRVT